MFKIGDKVVCVDDSPCRCMEVACSGETSLSKGKVYVVELVLPDTALVLIGVPAFPSHGLRGAGPWRFRKLDEIKAQNKVKQTQTIADVVKK